MDKLVDHLFIFEGNGVIRDYPGNYTQFRILEKSKQSYAAVSSDISSVKEHAVPTTEKKVETTLVASEKKVVEKMSYKEKLEFETLNKEMPVLEEKKTALTAQLNNASLNYEEIISISEKLSEVNAALELAEIRWLELSEKQ
jgi:ATP-binding cassette subfamily F protein uup